MGNICILSVYTDNNLPIVQEMRHFYSWKGVQKHESYFLFRILH